MIDEDRWFTNLHSRGNTGAASIFVMLDEAWQGGRFRPGDRILLVVPESGRFSFAFAHLTVCRADTRAGRASRPRLSLHAITCGRSGGRGRWRGCGSRSTAALDEVPIVRRIETGTATVEDYQRLLLHLRQQVVEGGRWISRAASNFSVELFDLRSAAIRHAAEEHRDFLLLERDYVAVGGSLDEIRGGRKNVGSEALVGVHLPAGEPARPGRPARRDVRHRGAGQPARAAAGPRRCRTSSG